ncbi:MAG: itaconate CoA-transferase [Gammaproteobacteria bacterium]|jgi:itaconate CoA-transferase
MSRPLEGITVVSIEQAVAAPLASARLRDAGARVIKIERAEGDFARNYDAAAKGDSSYFIWLNQGKESWVIDFKTADGAKQLHQLILNADVLIQNLGPGAIERAGFGYKSLRQLYPTLITCDISGYGEVSAMQGMRAYDLLIQAEAGLAAVSGGADEMGRIGVSICDIGAGMTAHAAILEALYRREKNAQGASLAVSLFDVAAEWMTVPLVHSDYGKGAPTRQGLRHPSISPYGAYQTGDGIQTLISIQNQREWQRLCEQVLLAPQLFSDEKFLNNNSRVENRDQLDEEIHSILNSLSAEEFRDRLKQRAIAFGAINEVSDLSRHPALRRRDAVNSTGETVPIPDHPVIWRDEDWRDSPGTPTVGRDSED